MKNIFRVLSVAVTGAALSWAAVEVPTAQAAILTYDFSVDVANGPLSGDTFIGWFSFDDTRFTGVGREVFDVPNDGLRIEYSFLGEVFDQNDESFEIFDRIPPVPSVAFNDGILAGLSYRVDEVRGTNLTPIPDPVQDFTILESGFGYRTTDDAISLGGTVEYELRQTPPAEPSPQPTAVPEPGIVLGLSSFGLAWFLRNRVSLSQSI